jgi:hypothetical protein
VTTLNPQDAQGQPGNAGTVIHPSCRTAIAIQQIEQVVANA